MPRLHPEALARLIEANGLLADADDLGRDDHDDRARRARRAAPSAAGERGPRRRPFIRPSERGTFKCGRCRLFVGPTVSGGRHRNHCPRCLTSRHVDDRRPGDRSSPCRALMAPVGTLFKAKGEQVVLHRCNGCGVERRCRVAADDEAAVLLRLPPVAAPGRGAAVESEGEEAAVSA